MGTNRRIFGGLLCLMMLAAACESTVPEVVFIVAGQSNAAGVHIRDAGEISARVSARALESPLWFEVGSAQAAVGAQRWLPLGKALVQPVYRVGPEAGIATSVLGSESRRVGLIKVAFDAAALAQNSAPDWHPDSEGELYGRLVRQVEAALAAKGSNSSVCLGGVFWIQGESDAKSGGPGFIPGQPEAASTYEGNLEALIQRMRRDLRSPDLPIVIASLNVPERDRVGRLFDYRALVMAAQVSVTARLPNVYLVSTEGLSMAPDGLHYSAQGQWELGIRLGTALSRVLVANERSACAP